mgnify:CR=1 FL=1
MSDGAMVPLGHDKYMARKAIFAFLGQKFHIYDANGTLCFFVHQKAFKLKEDIRVYTDDMMTEELLTIQARQVMPGQGANAWRRCEHEPGSPATATVKPRSSVWPHC